MQRDVSEHNQSRSLKTDQIDCDLVVVGGGIAGVCAAITAARQGAQVTLVQDRPVLGGNASSEVRLWILGATSHMGNNNRWAREGGVIDELLIENLYRNPEGNPLIFDTILLEKVVAEPNLRLLLNSAVYEARKHDADTIASVTAFCSQNSTRYDISAPLFVDASGDGILGFLAGAAFRMGAESEAEFGEKLAPSAEYGELLGHSLYFYSKDTGQPVSFVPPSFALDDITQIPRFRNFNTQEDGCRLWWIEYGGRLDTVHDTETIKWELWKIVYGVWDYIKNSGEFPDADTLTLEWVGHLPGKRESRRFEGDVMLTQQDVVEQRQFDDAVAHGGWALDLHPADGVYSEKPGCNQWHSRGVYAIPYRALYSRNIRNLFLAGRIFSASHVAFSSTRVQATLGAAAQAVGMAAAHCLSAEIQPRDLVEPTRMRALQADLQRSGQFIPDTVQRDAADLVQQANIQASSTLSLAALPPDGELLPLTASWAQLIPVQAGTLPRISAEIQAKAATSLTVELRTSDRVTNFTPDVLLATRTISLEAGLPHQIELDFDEVSIDEPRYVFVCFRRNEDVRIRLSEQRVTGLVSAANKSNPAVSNFGRQDPPEGVDIGVESFEFWTPARRPAGQNLALAFDPPLDLGRVDAIANGIARPTSQPNAWIAALDDPRPSLTLLWDEPQTIGQIELSFDTDFDHPLESVLMGHPEREMPTCVKAYRLCANGREVGARHNNHQTRNVIELDSAVVTDRLTIEVLETHGNAPAALFEMRVYGEK